MAPRDEGSPVDLPLDAEFPNAREPDQYLGRVERLEAVALGNA